MDISCEIKDYYATIQRFIETRKQGGFMEEHPALPGKGNRRDFCEWTAVGGDVNMSCI